MLRIRTVSKMYLKKVHSLNSTFHIQVSDEKTVGTPAVLYCLNFTAYRCLGQDSTAEPYTGADTLLMQRLRLDDRLNLDRITDAS